MLFLTIQPDERISLRFLVKYPYSANQVYPVRMDFSYRETFKTPPHQPYERLLVDVMKGDLTLFVREDTIEQMWGVVDPINERWESQAAWRFPQLCLRHVGTGGGRALAGEGGQVVAHQVKFFAAEAPAVLVFETRDDLDRLLWICSVGSRTRR